MTESDNRNPPSSDHQASDLQASELLNWPLAFPVTNARAVLKQQLEDFQVVEQPLFEPCGEGEHIWLEIEKRGANTAWVARQIAQFANVRDLDVGYAGLKDRHGVTRQWFSVYLPKEQAPEFSTLDNEEFRILQQTRHSKKLRRGDLLGNFFEITLREVTGDVAQIEHNLKEMVAGGFPNYFGNQRFGHDGNNIERGRAMLNREIRVRSRNDKSMYLSAVRSFLFNQILAERIRQDNWQQALSGDALNEQDLPCGPLWGRGRSATSDKAAEIEHAIVSQYETLCHGLEHSGLNQDQRSFVALPQNLSWEWRVDTSQAPANERQLILRFGLSAGYYATSLLREIANLDEPERRKNHGPDAGK